MGRYFATVFTTAVLFVPCFPARAADGRRKGDPRQGHQGLGRRGEARKVEAFSWKSKGTVNFNGNENEFTEQVTAKGLDHFRREFGNDQFHVRGRPRRRQGLAQVR